MPADAGQEALGSEKSVRCPMPGLVVSLAVAEGQEVKTGETLAVVEAMKMENFCAPSATALSRKFKSSPATALQSTP